MDGIKQTTKIQQVLLYIASALVLIMGTILYFLPEYTETYFAWTIGVPLTAAFLGGSYLASFILEFMAARESIWVRSRVAVPTALTFTALTAIVTFIHLDKFHLNATNPITIILTWAWILVYAIVPVLMIIILLQQLRAIGTNPTAIAALPLWFRLILGLQGLIMLGFGLGLLFSPEMVGSLWVWELTPLTSRAMGAWFMGLGVAATQSVIENDSLRLRPATISYAVFGLLQLINLLRFPNAAGLDWGQMKTWLYCAFVLSILLIGSFGVWQAQRHQELEHVQ